jgi:hypothetical protein
MASLTRADILGAVDRKLVSVAVPEWGGDVYIRQLTARERAEYEDAAAQIKDASGPLAGMRRCAMFLAAVLCDENGAALFGVGDAEEIMSRNFDVVQRLFRRAGRHNVITQADIDDLGKN